MKRLLHRLGSDIAQAQFKSSSDGLVFRAPVIWFWDRKRYYLINEMQRARIETILGGSHLAVWVLLIAFLLALLPLAVLPPPFVDSYALLFGLSRSGDLLILIVVASLSLGVLQNLYHVLAIRPMLIASPRATERITFVDRINVCYANYSRLRLLFVLALCALLLAFSTYRVFVAGGRDISDDIAVTILSCFAIYFALVRWVKRLSVSGNGVGRA